MIKIIKISFFSLVAITLIVLTGFIIKKNQVSVIDNVEVRIYRDSDNGFLNRDIILKTINNIDSISNLAVKDIDPVTIERKLILNPYIEEIDCYLTLNGTLLINVKEKNPIIRIFGEDDISMYLDNNGDFIPTSKQYTPRVIIANGYINDKIAGFNNNIHDTIYNNSVFRELFYLTKLIKQNSLLSSQINQIYYNSKGEYDLIPELGDHIIKFGKLKNSLVKLKKLEAFYKRNLKSSEWNKYKEINLTYKDQIVCTKK